MFTATFNRGFQLDFENGVSISVQWGNGNYCSNRNLSGGFLDAMAKQNALYQSQTAEVLIELNGEAITPVFADLINVRHDDRVVGWLTADQVAHAIDWARNYGKKNA